MQSTTQNAETHKAGLIRDRADAADYLTGVMSILDDNRDLLPDNPTVRQTLSGLVYVLQKWHEAGFGGTLPDDPDLQDVAGSLATYCARAECKMEKWWSQRISRSLCPEGTLRSFWYWQNYEALFEAETPLLSGSSDYAFVGSGALPITAILLARRFPGARCMCIDCDPEACDLSRDLFRALKLSTRMDVVQVCAENFLPTPGQTVICASLLDLSDGYGAMLKQIDVDRLVVRDAEGVFRFCYKPARLPPLPFIEIARTQTDFRRLNFTRHFVRRRSMNSATL